MYKERTQTQLRNWLSNKKSQSKKNDFNVEFEPLTFFKWYLEQEKVCHYCGLNEKEQFQLISKGHLNSKRFFTSKNGTRGKHLEIDRKNPLGPYSVDNCVLSCYFCNNDKSDIFSEEGYIKFINSSRVEYLRELIR